MRWFRPDVKLSTLPTTLYRFVVGYFIIHARPAFFLPSGSKQHKTSADTAAEWMKLNTRVTLLAECRTVRSMTRKASLRQSATSAA